MANIMIRGRVVDDLYDTAYTFTRHLPGGLAVATILACTVFAAISGSSVATAMTIGAVAIPQMLRFGYDERLAYGVVAAGGTLGILIPPSGPMILYGVTTDTSIGGLFMGGIVPGALLAGVFILWAMVRSALSGNMQREKMASLSEMAIALHKSFWSILMPVLVLGGIFSPRPRLPPQVRGSPWSSPSSSIAPWVGATSGFPHKNPRECPQCCS